MKRRHAVALLVLAGIPVAGPAQSLDSLKAAASDPLTGLLQQQLGISADQAKGGVGSVLTLAQEHLAKGDFDKIAELIPGASKYMDAAKKLGAVDGPLKNLSGLNSALSRLGITPETAAKFVPAVTDFVGKAGGSDMKALLAGALQ
jgi:hypothetical protein